MRLSILLKTAFRSLIKNKMRSFLTMLGIIIGVASVVAMLAIGQGSRDSIQQSISSMGTNMIMVIPSAQTSGGVHMDAGSQQSLKAEDADAIAQRCPSVAYVTPLVSSAGQLIAGTQNWRTVIFGTTADYFQIRDIKVISGSVFSRSEERSSAKVCLVGQTVVKNLFGEGVDPVGRNIRINKIPFRIIGLLEPKGQNTFGQDQDDIVIAPFQTVQRRMLAITYVRQILISARTEALIPRASEEIAEVLDQRHKIGANDEPDYTIRTQTELSNIFSTTTRVLTILLASIASISLVVGGIGIMNIMLVSITERTREIGLRLAVGAKGSAVLLQFLIESVLLSFIGGLIGLLLGILISRLVAGLMSWPIVVSPGSIALAFIFSAVIGIFFGWYPARKAARMNPIEALRYE